MLFFGCKDRVLREVFERTVAERTAGEWRAFFLAGHLFGFGPLLQCRPIPFDWEEVRRKG